MIIKNIFTKIYISPLLYIFMLLFLFTGNIRKISIFMFLIFIHELGHFMTATILNWKTDKICLYPYGGVSRFNNMINTDLREEALVLIMGPVVQYIFYFILKSFISYRYLSILVKYNYFILFFNLLPIYPLDGGKLLLILFCKLKPYKKAFDIVIFVSIITEMIIFILSIFNNIYLISIIIILTLIKTRKEKKYFVLVFQKFILERIRYVFNFKKTILIDDVFGMMHDKRHLILDDGIYIDEREYLKRYYYKKK